MPSREAIDDFLAQRRIAVVGVSRDTSAFANAVYRSLRDSGHELVPVHPEADELEGDATVGSVGELRGERAVDGLVVVLPTEAADAVVHEAVEAGVPRVWIHKGLGGPEVPEDAVAFCHEHGVEVVDGACPFMFNEPVTGFHRVHRGLQKLVGHQPH